MSNNHIIVYANKRSSVINLPDALLISIIKEKVQENEKRLTATTASC